MDDGQFKANTNLLFRLLAMSSWECVFGFDYDHEDWYHHYHKDNFQHPRPDVHR